MLTFKTLTQEMFHHYEIIPYAKKGCLPLLIHLQANRYCLVGWCTFGFESHFQHCFPHAKIYNT